MKKQFMEWYVQYQQEDSSGKFFFWSMSFLLLALFVLLIGGIVSSIRNKHRLKSGTIIDKVIEPKRTVTRTGSYNYSTGMYSGGGGTTYYDIGYRLTIENMHKGKTRTEKWYVCYERYVLLSKGDTLRIDAFCLTSQPIEKYPEIS